MTTTIDSHIEHGASINRSSCRFCGSTLKHTFIDLKMSPLCESYVTPERLNQMEQFYPLHVLEFEK